jgi:hypothetical protein
MFRQRELRGWGMKQKLVGLFSAVFALMTTGAFAATRVAANGGCCPPSPLSH